MRKSIYLERYAWKDSLFPSYIAKSDLALIVVIPAYKEEHLLKALDSLNTCDKPNGGVLIIVLINEAETTSEDVIRINQKCQASVNKYDSKFDLLYSYQRLPIKKAGVGLARKIGMDEAVRIFEGQGKDGLILCFDADCTCDTNYLVEVEKQFASDKNRAGVVFYEHEFQGKNHEAIVNYELYLRYYIDAIRHSGFPFAHQTLGSCIITRSSIYQSEGGMSTRKAGEDFYFLNKVIPLGGFVEINRTTVYPSDRVSDRVPFGTGKAVEQLLNSNEPYEVYNPKSFIDLRNFFSQATAIWNDDPFDIPESIFSFFNGDITTELEKIKSQTTSLTSFTQRFFLWFDAFRILKFIHFSRDHYYPNVPISQALTWLFNILDLQPASTILEDQLVALRDYDRLGLNQVK